jgi:hypothetical protein
VWPFAAVALITLSGLVFEIGLTRIYSATILLLVASPSLIESSWLNIGAPVRPWPLLDNHLHATS